MAWKPRLMRPDDILTIGRATALTGPTVGWVAGETGETTRDAAQRVLIGRTGTNGTGTIPNSLLRKSYHRARPRGR